MKTKQLKFKTKSRQKKQHGGSLAVKKRRSRRPLNLKQSHHITMKSHHAIGARSLFRHKKMILKIIRKFSARFRVKVYDYAIQGNHIHMLVKAKTREELQNFFRVVAGHTAQKILQEHPLKQDAGGAPGQSDVRSSGGAPSRRGRGKGCAKNQRKFWSYLLYSRIVSWGRDFKNVIAYIEKNTLELLQLIAYQPRNGALKNNIRFNIII